MHKTDRQFFAYSITSSEQVRNITNVSCAYRCEPRNFIKIHIISHNKVVHQTAEYSKPFQMHCNKTTRYANDRVQCYLRLISSINDKKYFKLPKMIAFLTYPLNAIIYRIRNIITVNITRRRVRQLLGYIPPPPGQQTLSRHKIDKPRRKAPRRISIVSTVCT